jgi:PHD/YefM family antitoxin component YafN of YafNO toxin-antitoxin module
MKDGYHERIYLMIHAKKITMKDMMNLIVPITRFNRGEANKIFEEVKETGVKAVLKNNVRVGVILDPKQYDEMVELLEDYALFFEAERRVKKAESAGFLSEKQLMDQLNIREADLNNTDDVEIE